VKPPQLENGHIKIANELFDAILQYPFSKREYAVVLAVLRKTYGYNKKTDDISASQIAAMTGMQRTHVSSCLAELARKNVIAVSGGKFANNIGINKKYWEWASTKTVHPSTETVHVPKRYTSSTKTVHNLVPKRYTQKTTPKDNTKDKAQAPVLPSGLSADKWAEWEQHRREIKKRLTPSTIKKQLNFLAKQPDPGACIDASITNGWTGLFAIKEKINGHDKSQRKLSAAERVQRAIAERDANASPDGRIVDSDGWIVR
jgi:phage replication O-like protein O